MSSGTLLFSKPIHPSASHQYLAHLSRMYNAFGGGIDFSVKVCGTGFHAGALMIVRIPPNLKPEKISSLQDLTAFEYLVIDPKCLEVVSETVIDQRNVMFHWMPLDLENRQTFGGYFCIYVLVPLNTSATGSSQIALQVFERPSRMFNFIQLRPLDLITPQQIVPEQITQALDFQTTQYIRYPRSAINYMIANPVEQLPLVQYETYYCRSFTGDLMNPSDGQIPTTTNYNYMPVEITYDDVDAVHYVDWRSSEESATYPEIAGTALHIGSDQSSFAYAQAIVSPNKRVDPKVAIWQGKLNGLATTKPDFQPVTGLLIWETFSAFGEINSIDKTYARSGGR